MILVLIFFDCTLKYRKLKCTLSFGTVNGINLEELEIESKGLLKRKVINLKIVFSTIILKHLKEKLKKLVPRAVKDKFLKPEVVKFDSSLWIKLLLVSYLIQKWILLCLYFRYTWNFLAWLLFLNIQNIYPHIFCRKWL